MFESGEATTCVSSTMSTALWYNGFGTVPRRKLVKNASGYDVVHVECDPSAYVLMTASPDHLRWKKTNNFPVAQSERTVTKNRGWMGKTENRSQELPKVPWIPGHSLTKYPSFIYSVHSLFANLIL